MKIELDKAVEDLKGNAIQRDGKIFTIREAVQDALLGSYQDEQNLNGTEKMNRWKLCMKLNNGAADLQVEDLAKIKELVAKAYSPLVVGRVYEVIEAAR